VTELLDAIDSLTKPVVLHFPQIGDDGKWLRAHTTQLPSLLAQLEAAIHSSISGKAGGGDPATRAVLNSAALFEFARIRTTVGDWCHIEKVRVSRDVVSDLRRWYVARLAREQRDDDFYVRELGKWAGIIRFQLEPAKVVPLTVPCVVCDAALWVDGEGVSHPYPLVVEYMEHDPDILSSAKALCRACEKVWRGSRELRELRWAIDEREAS
jgi:hypothetical protein